MGGTVAISIVLAVAIFMVLPYYISVFFQRFITSQTLLALLEGVIRPYHLYRICGGNFTDAGY